MLSAGALALGSGAWAAAAAAPAAAPAGRRLSAAQFGAVGDGVTDDSQALQAALDETFAGEPGVLVIPPGTYRVTRTLRVRANTDMSRQSGISGRGARLLSAIADGQNVLEFVSRATVRFVFIEGLDILGSGRDGHGLHVECESNTHSFYNFCLRDIVVQNCGGDGCHLVGNVFEGQLINSYFRQNKGNGATFSHGQHEGVLSSVHIFGCIFGDNGRQGAALHQCYDVSFHGCYFLQSGEFGLVADNGCMLLSDCGFENNHQKAKGFEDGGAGIDLRNFGTLIGCMAYSMQNQTHLVRGYVVGQLVMVGCSGWGDSRAKAAGLAKLGGQAAANATLVGCSGTVEYVDGFEGLEIAGRGGGIRFGASWQSRNLPRLGEYRLWVDRSGRLRLKKGAPGADDDGTVVGA